MLHHKVHEGLQSYHSEVCLHICDCCLREKTKVCACVRERAIERDGLEEGGSTAVHLHSGSDEPSGQMAPPLCTHAHTQSERERGSAAGPLRAEPRSHSLQRGREKRRDRGRERERVREGVRLKVCE